MDNYRLLVIEDECEIADSVKLVCESFIDNFEVIVCLDPTIALNVAKENNPDLILLDLSMPKMNGWTLFDFFRKDDKLKDIPIAIFSASPTNFTEYNILNLMKTKKADGYIIKPFRMREMVEQIKLLLPFIQTNSEYERRFKS